jgi:hypothetical protein
LLAQEKYGLVNEIFALHLGLARIGINVLHLDPAYNKIAKELIYQLYYRDINPKQLYITLELLKENIDLKQNAPPAKAKTRRR